MSVGVRRVFHPVKRPVVDEWIADSILHADEGRPVRLPYPGLEAEAVRLGDAVAFKVGGCEYTVSLESLTGVIGSRRMFMVGEEGLEPLEVRGEGYYKLYPVAPGRPPTLEVNGIHMHRVSGSDPESDTIAKVRAARIRRGVKVLDVCTGLGYTAIYSLGRGAGRVLTIEVDERVLHLAERNPWSWPLGDQRVEIILGDAVEVLPSLADESFDRIIHDPPRLTPATGGLYGLDFYKELYRVLKPGGVLFHYTGEPGRLRGLNVPGGVASRLKKVGFMVEAFDRGALGVVAVKPR